MREIRIKRVILVVLFVSLAMTAAADFSLPSLPPPVFDDGEVSVMSVCGGSGIGAANRFRLSLALQATPSNSVEIALGGDRLPSDGRLEAEEAALVVGWDGGAWFLRRPGLRDTLVHTPTDAGVARRRALTMEMRITAAGTMARSAAFVDGEGAVCFADFDAGQLAPADWDTVRLTARGADTADVAAAGRFLTDGAVIMVR